MDDSVQYPGDLIGPRTLQDPWENRIINASSLRLLDVDWEHDWVPVMKQIIFKTVKIEVQNILYLCKRVGLSPTFLKKTPTMCFTLWRDVMSRTWKDIISCESFRLGLEALPLSSSQTLLSPCSVPISILVSSSLATVTLVKWLNEKYLSFNVNLVYLNSGCTCQVILRLCLLPVSLILPQTCAMNWKIAVHWIVSFPLPFHISTLIYIFFVECID